MKRCNHIYLFILYLFLIACNNSKDEKGNSFQLKYRTENKVAVKDSIKALIEFEKEKNKKVDTINEYYINRLEINEIDSNYVNNQIKKIRSQAKFIRENNIPGVPDGRSKDDIMKALSSHDDSLVNFYENFHGYTVIYSSYIISLNGNSHYTSILWVDTNINIKLESHPKSFPIVIDKDSAFTPNFMSKVLVKKWWPDTMPRTIDTMFLESSTRKNANVEWGMSELFPE